MGRKNGVSSTPHRKEGNLSDTLQESKLNLFKKKKISLNSFDGRVSLSGTPSGDMAALQPWDLIGLCCDGWRLWETLTFRGL